MENKPSRYCRTLAFALIAAMVLLFGSGPLGLTQDPAPKGTSKATTKAAPTSAKTLTPPVEGGFPVMPGSSWKIDGAKKDAAVQSFLFCHTGRWQIVTPSLPTGSVSPKGIYKLHGDSIIVKNTDDGKVMTYKKAWKDNVLELNDGPVTLRLRYDGATECQ